MLLLFAFYVLAISVMFIFVCHLFRRIEFLRDNERGVKQYTYICGFNILFQIRAGFLPYSQLFLQGKRPLLIIKLEIK